MYLKLYLLFLPGMFDRDHSGTIDLNEFQALWSYIHQWKGVFDQFDKDRSGHIDSNELHTGEQSLMKHFSGNCTQGWLVGFANLFHPKHSKKILFTLLCNIENWMFSFTLQVRMENTIEVY